MDSSGAPDSAWQLRYERELEVEKEVEKEVERQVPTMTPYHEEEWDVSQVVHADSVVSLKIETFSIPDVFAATHSLNRYKSIWPKVIKVYCTRNFRQAINEAAGLDEYLRPVDAVVAFESGGLLLLSEREGEQALVAFWTAQVAQATRPRACFVNMPLWRKGFSSQPAGLLPNVADVPRVLCDPPALVSLQVFMGDTSFKDVAQQESLRALATSMGRDAAGVMKQLEPRLQRARSKSHMSRLRSKSGTARIQGSPSWHVAPLREE